MIDVSDNLYTFSSFLYQPGRPAMTIHQVEEADEVLFKRAREIKV